MSDLFPCSVAGEDVIIPEIVLLLSVLPQDLLSDKTALAIVLQEIIIRVVRYDWMRGASVFNEEFPR